jgi:hypothetical protein
MRGVRLLMIFKPMTEACGWRQRAALSQRATRIFLAGAALRVILGGASREVWGSG